MLLLQIDRRKRYLSLMKAFSIIIFSLLLVSCKNNSTVIDTGISIDVLDQQGQNLLTNPATYTKDNIEVYYVVNGQAQLYDKPNLGISKGFIISKGINGNNDFRVYLNFNRKERYSVTLVKFGTSKTDTIKAKFKFTRESVFKEKITFLSPQLFFIA